MGRLSGKVAVITGSAQGIGAVYARALAEEGARVVVSDVLDCAKVLGEIKAAGGEAVAVPADVTKKDQVEALMKAAAGAFGKIDILVNNAALFGVLENKPFTEIDSEEWDRVMSVNVRGTFECCKAVLPYMRANGYGKIVNIASGTFFKGVPWLLHYVSSKGAIIAMTRAMSREIGKDNICVNALAPGLTLSDAVLHGASDNAALIASNRGSRALGRDQEPDTLIGPMLYLCSADSDFMTGQTILVDGGSGMH